MNLKKLGLMEELEEFVCPTDICLRHRQSCKETLIFVC